MMLRRSGTFMDTMSSGSNRAGIPSCVSATSKAYEEPKTEEGGTLLTDSKPVFPLKLYS